MDDKATRLQFTEEDLADKRISSAAKRAEKAADKADEAADKLPRQRKLNTKSQAEMSVSKKLRFEDGEIKDVTEAGGRTEGKAVSSTAEKAAGDTIRGARSARNAGTGVKNAAGNVGKAANGVKSESAGSVAKRPSLGRRAAGTAPGRTASAQIHREIGSNEDDNAGTDSLNEGTEFIEDAVYTVEDASHYRKVRQYDKAEKLMEKSDKANVDALYEKKRQTEPDAQSNPLSRWMQRKQIKNEYAAAKGGYAASSAAGSAAASHAAEAAGSTAGAAGKAAKESTGFVESVSNFIESNSTVIIGLLCAGGLIAVVMGTFSSCSAFLPGMSGAVVGTTYTAEDSDILAVEADYCAMESALDNEINSIDTSGYDEVNYYLDEIGHNPFELASYLTILYEDYTRDEVQDELKRLFDIQYEFETDETVEIYEYTETYEYYDEETDSYYTEKETETYEYYILNVTLRNNGLAAAISDAGFTEDESERYMILLSLYGNKEYLFEDSIYAIARTGEYADYQVSAEALSDEKFANMIAEAEKYLGYPYVWGGSSPSTGFDCSGFVCWVINNCGNGWSVGRLTANGLKNICTTISPSEAKPGDLIFFQGTYDTTGASHVGIYVGDGMMIHAGSPIQYTSFSNSTYFREHFYCFGRLSGM